MKGKSRVCTFNPDAVLCCWNPDAAAAALNNHKSLFQGGLLEIASVLILTVECIMASISCYDTLGNLQPSSRFHLDRTGGDSCLFISGHR